MFSPLLIIKVRNLKNSIYVFIQEFPRFVCTDNWEYLFNRFLCDFPSQISPICSLAHVAKPQ